VSARAAVAANVDRVTPINAAADKDFFIISNLSVFVKEKALTNDAVGYADRVVVLSLVNAI